MRFLCARVAAKSPRATASRRAVDSPADDRYNKIMSKGTAHREEKSVTVSADAASSEISRRRLPQNVLTIFLQIVAAGVVVASFAIAARAYAYLPDEIGVHFDASGTIDGYGGKGFLFLSSGFCTAAFVFMTVGNYVKVRWRINLIVPVYIDALAGDNVTRAKIYRLLSVAWNLTVTFFILAMLFVGISVCMQDRFQWTGFLICLGLSLLTAFGSVFAGAYVLSVGKKKDGGESPSDG